jgi:hypothetical protein
MTRLVQLAASLAIVAGCASNQGTHPQDMNMAGHEHAAKQEEAKAAEHQAQQTASPQETNTSCLSQGVCWGDVADPNAEHAARAERHRELAAKHRGAATALARAEAQSCVGIAESDRDMSPFAHRDDIRSVQPVQENQQVGKGTVSRQVGARVVFRAVPGMTAEWLQRLVDCHLARAAAAGNEMPEMDYCPLMLKGVTARVSSVGDGFAVDIRSSDPATQDAILKRVNALAPATSP